MKVLITGANGFLGQHLCLYLHKNKYEVFAISRGKSKIPNPEIPYFSIELHDKTPVLKFIEQIKPDIIIHTAAMSKPDECHLHPENCLINNVKVTEILLEAAKLIDARFLYISTDFVFGEGGPHPETAIPNPLNFYGESKRKAEILVSQSGLKHNIIRPVFIYGPNWEGMRPSFIQWVQQQLELNKKIQVVTDQKRTPTYVLDICWGIERLLHFDTNEIFHFAGAEILSPYEMATTVANILSLDAQLIEPVTAGSFPEIVRRAKASGLTTETAQKILDFKPHSFEEALYQSFFYKA